MIIPIGETTAKNEMDATDVSSLVFDAISSIPIQNEMTNLWEATAPNITHTVVDSYKISHEKLL